MPSFVKESNYTEESSFSQVLFGADAPVLEVEVNELQQILNAKLKRLTEIIGNCVVPLSNGGISYNSTTKVLTLTNCVIIADGVSTFIDTATVTMSATNKCAYIRAEEKTVTGSDILKKYGNTAGVNITNSIIDSRLGTETSRRKVIALTLIAGESIPANTDTLKYTPVGTVEGTDFIAEYAVAPYSDLGLSVVNGKMCITYDDNE